MQADRWLTIKAGFGLGNERNVKLSLKPKTPDPPVPSAASSLFAPKHQFISFLSLSLITVYHSFFLQPQVRRLGKTCASTEASNRFIKPPIIGFTGCRSINDLQFSLHPSPCTQTLWVSWISYRSNGYVNYSIAIETSDRGPKGNTPNLIKQYS